MMDAERDKKLRLALYLMLGACAVGAVLYWAIQTFLAAPFIAFGVLAIAVFAGAGNYVYQTHKLRPKDKP